MPATSRCRNCCGERQDDNEPRRFLCELRRWHFRYFASHKISHSGPVAQCSERPDNRLVGGSSPPSPTTHEGGIGCRRRAGAAGVKSALLVGMHALSVVEDRYQLLADGAGPVDRQLGDDLVDRGDHGAGLLHAAQCQLIAVLRPRSRGIGGHLYFVTFLQHLQHRKGAWMARALSHLRAW